MKKGTTIWLMIAIVLLIGGFIIQVTVMPSDETRVIIDHTQKVYSAPACYDQAGLTNNLEETTLGYAKKLDYMSESNCTDQEFSGEQMPFLLSLFR
ncbi:hypothetical protein [Halalkalibacter alkalisediminis]|uniref:Uncharacterized protein n=1 Tax=Halalkalibacter alkalisediminis TaxID=935616 RepID=A0ABV6NBR1_9BACI|nr:hypothetical protein [Halalkalibacter alkalisediminis]